MHKTYIQYIISNIHQILTSNMHNLKANFHKFFIITKSVFKDRLNQFYNFYFYQNKPEMSDCENIALSVTGEYIGIDSESYFWGKLKSDHKNDFPRLIRCSNFNRRGKRLYPFTEELNQHLAGNINESEDVYIVDYIPVPVSKSAREKQNMICKESFETAPDKGYSAVTLLQYHNSKNNKQLNHFKYALVS